MREKKSFCVQSFSVSRYIKGDRKSHPRHNCSFRNKCMCKQPTFRKQKNYNILRKCFTFNSDILIGSVFFLLLAIIQSGLHEKPKRKDRVTEKRTQKNLCKRHPFFWLHTLLPISFFVTLFCLLSPFVYSNFSRKKTSNLQVSMVLYE